MNENKFKTIMILDAFKKAIELKEVRNWKKIYVMVDIHGTIFESDYGKGDSYIFTSPDCKTCLQKMTEDGRITLILWTSTYEHDIIKYLEELGKYGIKFDYINSNPEEKSNNLSDFSQKPYFNVLLDDKSGFNPETDWSDILNYLYPKVTEDELEFYKNFRLEITTYEDNHKSAKLYQLRKVTRRKYLFWKVDTIEKHLCAEYGTAPSNKELREYLSWYWEGEKQKKLISKEEITGDKFYDIR